VHMLVHHGRIGRLRAASARTGQDIMIQVFLGLATQRHGSPVRLEADQRLKRE
jgi:hypothetical protein